jgi:hypothetical protein
MTFGLMAGVIASVAFAAAFPSAILAGDPVIYRERMVELFSGKLPYVDFPFEHLPGMVIPMALAWLLGGSLSERGYLLTFAALMAILLWMSGMLIRALEARIGARGITSQWLVVLLPLLPFVLFRNDAWPLFLTLLGLYWLASGRSRLAAAVGLLATLTKLWPAVIGASAWWRGKRGAALISGPMGVGLAVLVVLSPGFATAQAAGGLHTETLIGSAVGLVRSLAGGPLGLTRTAAVYLDAPGWFQLGNLVVGGWLGWAALRAYRHARSWHQAWLLTGVAVLGLILASPYFSTQYLLWLSPFVAAASPRTVRSGMAINLLSLLLITTWWQLFTASPWWWAVLLLRNLLLLGLGMSLLSQATAGDEIAGDFSPHLPQAASTPADVQVTTDESLPDRF